MISNAPSQAAIDRKLHRRNRHAPEYQSGSAHIFHIQFIVHLNRMALDVIPRSLSSSCYPVLILHITFTDRFCHFQKTVSQGVLFTMINMCNNAKISDILHRSTRYRFFCFVFDRRSPAQLNLSTPALYSFIRNILPSAQVQADMNSALA
jgi:hypothetical protein